MSINKDSLVAKIKKTSKETGKDALAFYNRFFLDEFVKELSQSKFGDLFALKGGLFLSQILGLQDRSTVDIDLYFEERKFEKSLLIKILDDVCSKSRTNDVKFAISFVKNIKTSREGGGFRFGIVGKFKNLESRFYIDIATGDPIVPGIQKKEYKCFFPEEVFTYNAYSLESVAAEKLHTALVRGVNNSRFKDLFDLFLLKNLEIDLDNLKLAFKATCDYRMTPFTKDECHLVINSIETNVEMKKRLGVIS